MRALLGAIIGMDGFREHLGMYSGLEDARASG